MAGRRPRSVPSRSRLISESPPLLPRRVSSRDAFSQDAFSVVQWGSALTAHPGAALVTPSSLPAQLCFERLRGPGLGLHTWPRAGVRLVFR